MLFEGEVPTGEIEYFHSAEKKKGKKNDHMQEEKEPVGMSQGIPVTVELPIKAAKKLLWKARLKKPGLNHCLYPGNF
ncbi:MAG: hypothetical protein V2A65_05355 [Candidatus Omnitrophota bacterium]